MYDDNFEDAKLLGYCPCGQSIAEGYERVVVDEEYYCDVFCVYEHFVKKHYEVEEF
jgi:hypothetical protein